MAVFRKASSTLTAAAAGNYDANDVISDSASNNAGTALAIECESNNFLIVGLQAVCSEDSVVNRLRVHLFDDNPAAAAVEMDDGATFAITTSTDYIGYIDLPALADRGGISQAQNFTVRMPVKLSKNDTAIYAVLETLDAETNETAGMTIRLDLNYAIPPF